MNSNSKISVTYNTIYCSRVCGSALSRLGPAGLGEGQLGWDPGCRSYSGLLSISPHSRGHRGVLVTADGKGTGSRKYQSRIFSTSACIKFISIH